jgi:chromate transporter
MQHPASPTPAPQVSLRALFFRFLEVGLSGFGGVLPFARRMLVDQRRWLSEPEFAEFLSLSQFLPGPNIVNLAVMVGRRFQGPAGAFAAFMGLMLMPMVIVMALATVYSRYSDLPLVHQAFGGVAAAASGLVLSMGVKMARSIRHDAIAIGFGAASFAAIALARLPMLWVIAVVAPLSIGVAWMRRR